MVHMMIEDRRTKGGDRNSIVNDLTSDTSPSLAENTINLTCGS